MEKIINRNKAVDFNEVLKVSSGLPGVRIDRMEFLRTQLRGHFDEETVSKAILHNPAYAGIPVEEIDKLADACIRYETTQVTAMSFAAGIPGGLAMLGTIPADFAQYFGHMLRILQKLIYLYGWQALFGPDGQMDDETANLLTLFTGIMFGVTGASNAIIKISNSAAARASKSIAQKALTKGTIYPIVKKVATTLGIKMTKDVFAKSVSKVIPVIGGVASGGLTYVTYRPMAEKLKEHLTKLKIADVNFYNDLKSGVVEVKDFTEVEFETI